MNPKTFAALIFTTTLLGGCATMNAPSSEEIAALPVIPYGQTPPEDRRYILHFPAGRPVTLPVRIDGRLFTRPDQETLSVTLARDVYSYKDWVSFDGKSWRPGGEVLDMTLKLQLPSWEHPRSGELTLHIDPEE